jgi:hypothetical membrane protein
MTLISPHWPLWRAASSDLGMAGLYQAAGHQATIILTAVVTVLFVYWQRDRERR